MRWAGALCLGAGSSTHLRSPLGCKVKPQLPLPPPRPPGPAACLASVTNTWLMVTHLLTSLRTEEGPGYMWGNRALESKEAAGPRAWARNQSLFLGSAPKSTVMPGAIHPRPTSRPRPAPGPWGPASSAQARPADGVAGIQAPLRDRVMREGLSCPSGWLSPDPERASAGAPRMWTARRPQQAGAHLRPHLATLSESRPRGHTGL